MDLSIKVNGQPVTARIVFATRATSFEFIAKWQKDLGDDQNPRRVAAVELAQVAVYRFQAHAEIDTYAESIEDFKDHILVNPKTEVAALVLLECASFADSKVIALAHFRRTWNNNIVLDYLASHPYVAKHKEGHPQSVNSSGKALLYFISHVAKECHCELIWGEATPTSCSYYQHVFSLPSVEDLILIPKEKFMEFIESFSAKRSSNVAVNSKTIQEIDALEQKDTPFVGSKTAVFNPKRLLAYHFLDLPHHVQIAIAQALGLLQDDDKAQPAPEQFRRFFKRATEQGKLAEMWREVEKRHPEGRPERNPFLTSSDKEAK